MDTPTKRRVCVRGIIHKNGKLFCQELKNSDGTGRGFWCTPGGGLEYGESLTEGLRRELVEETGVEPTIGTLLFVQQYSEKPTDETSQPLEFLEFFFHIENPDDFETIDEHASHFDAEIFRYGFIDPAASNVLPAFLQTIDIATYASGSQPVYLYTEFNQN